MSDDVAKIRKRLTRSFHETFQEGLPEDVTQATMENTNGWDSMATWTLLMVVQEQFNITIGLDLIPKLTSFSAFETIVSQKVAA